MTDNSAPVNFDNENIWSSIRVGSLIDSGLHVAKEPYHGVELCECREGAHFENGFIGICKLYLVFP